MNALTSRPAFMLDNEVFVGTSMKSMWLEYNVINEDVKCVKHLKLLSPMTNSKDTIILAFL